MAICGVVYECCHFPYMGETSRLGFLLMINKFVAQSWVFQTLQDLRIRHETLMFPFSTILRAFHRADSRLMPGQWETALQSNAVSHWLGTNLESSSLQISEPFGLPDDYTALHEANKNSHFPKLAMSLDGQIGILSCISWICNWQLCSAGDGTTAEFENTQLPEL